MANQLEGHLSGEASTALRSFYERLPRVPRSEWPALLHGMGFNFEFYDALFILLIANVQLCLDDCDYTPRHRAMQHALLPFCSEYGIELGQKLQHSHRHLYADFYRAATGQALPERYPASKDNPWLAASRRWAEVMRRAVDSQPGAGERARFCLGYFWAVEHLSVDEFTRMRATWRGLGVDAAYLDVHVAVEDDHDAHSTRAVLSFTDPDDPLVAEAVRAHEQHLAGYYTDLARLVPVDGATVHA